MVYNLLSSSLLALRWWGDEDGGGNPSRNTQQYKSFQSRPGAPKDCIMVPLMQSGFEVPSERANEHHNCGGYYEGTHHHANSTPSSACEGHRGLESGWFLVHSTSVEKALQILVDGYAVPSEKGPGADCPAGHPGIYGFPMKSMDEKDIEDFLKGPNSYRAGAWVIMGLRGAIVKGKGTHILTDGFIGYHLQNNKQLQVAAHSTTVSHPQHYLVAASIIHLKNVLFLILSFADLV